MLELTSKTIKANKLTMSKLGKKALNCLTVSVNLLLKWLYVRGGFHLEAMVSKVHVSFMHQS